MPLNDLEKQKYMAELWNLKWGVGSTVTIAGDPTGTTFVVSSKAVILNGMAMAHLDSRFLISLNVIKPAIINTPAYFPKVIPELEMERSL